MIAILLCASMLSPDGERRTIREGDRTTVLVVLVDKATVDALLKAVKEVVDPRRKYDALLSLSTKSGLCTADADKVAAASPSIRDDDFESALLIALVGRASKEAIERAASEIRDEHCREAVLRKLRS